MTMARNECRSIDILLVEDNTGDVELTLESFKAARILNKIHVVNDGAQAVDFMKRRGRYVDAPRPDLVLLDLNLPRMDGREVLAEIKGDPDLCVIPIIVLTSSEAEEDVLKVYQLHANGYVRKPISLDRFMEIVQGIESFWLKVVVLPPKIR